MGNISLNRAAVLTFSYEAQMFASKGGTPQETPFLRGASVLNVLSYISVIGNIAGIARIILCAALRNKYEMPDTIVIMQSFRGILEILGLGPFMIILDPIVTAVAIKAGIIETQERSGEEERSSY